MPRYLLILFVMALGCARPQEKEIQITQEGQFVKVAISTQKQRDSLRQSGLELIVDEVDYAIIKTSPAQISIFSDLKLQTFSPQETDFVQRLVNISIDSKETLQKIADMGVDIWEVKNDTVLAQVYDTHIKQLEASGMSVSILEENSKNVVKKQ